MKCGVYIIGPDLFAADSTGKISSSIASIFPAHRILVTVRGIHATQANIACDFLRETILSSASRIISVEEEDAIYHDAVSLFVRDGFVLIRSEPEDMDKIFAADETLQLLVPKQCIQFTGKELAEVRKELRMRGESWRISLAPHSVEEMCHYIRSSRVSVGTDAVYYQSAATGERFLTYEEFMGIRRLLKDDTPRALARLKEIVTLHTLSNKQGVRELSFFAREGSLSLAVLRELIEVLENESSTPMAAQQAEGLFDRFAASFGEATGISLMSDSEMDPIWRTAIFCKLFGIDADAIEECCLGLSPEFHLNVRWLPGGRILEGQAFFESDALPRVKSLILHYLERYPGLASINLGRVESSLTTRDRSGEQREVYLIALGLSDEAEEIRLVRMIKWDVMHRLRNGLPLQHAVSETKLYHRYINDRLKAFAALKIPIPHYTDIEIWESIPGMGEVPVYFFDRPYIEGLATEKIVSEHYARPGFMIRLAGLLGMAAAVSLVMGRACPRDGHIFFDDGDEVIHFDREGFPERLMITETTGSFNDWRTPVAAKLPHCLSRLLGHLEKAKSKGISKAELWAAVEAFSEGLVREIVRLQKVLEEENSRLRSLYSDRSEERGGIRRKWDRLLERLEATRPDEVRETITNAHHLARYRE